MSFIKQRTTTQQTDVLAGYLPNDDLHALKNKDGSNIRKVLIGLAAQWGRFRDTINEVYAEYDPENTTALIEEWEEFVGIPDECISNDGTLEERRVNILLKLSGINATTAKQFETIAAVLGYTVVVETGIEVGTFPLTLPFILLSAGAAPFTIVVTLDGSLEPSGFPLTLPFILSAEAPNVLLCFFEKIKPANTDLVFRYGPRIIDPGELTGGVLWLDASIQASGAVSLWADQFITGNDAVQGTGAKQPTSGVTTENSLNVLDYDGGDTLEMPSGVFTIPSGDNTLFVVSKTSLTTTRQRIIGMTESAGARYLLEYSAAAGNMLWQSRSASGSGVTLGSVTKDNFNIFTCFKSGTTQSIAVNNGTPATNASGLDEAGIDRADISGADGASLLLTGSIAEIIMYNRALSTTEITDINTYLSNKWAITI